MIICSSLLRLTASKGKDRTGLHFRCRILVLKNLHSKGPSKNKKIRLWNFIFNGQSSIFLLESSCLLRFNILVVFCRSNNAFIDRGASTRSSILSFAQTLEIFFSGDRNPLNHGPVLFYTPC